MTESKTRKITLKPTNAEVKAEAGTPLRDLLFEQGVEFPCGGHGRCRGCKVRVLAGHVEVNDAQRRHLKQSELDEGWRLADLLLQCQSVQAESSSHLPSLAFIDSLLEAIQQAESGRQSNQPPVEGRAGPTTTHLEDGLPISLSAREMEVLALIAEGKSNQEISAELYLALNTVKRHAYNIFAKLEVKKRTQAVSKARQLGLIP